MRDVIEEPAIYWAEYQALVDPVNFYKTDPVAEMGLPACGKPIVRIVRIRDMLTPASYRAMRGHFFRIHRQFVLGNERRYFYDFFMICCGPLPLKQWVERPDSPCRSLRPTRARRGACAGTAPTPRRPPMPGIHDPRARQGDLGRLHRRLVSHPLSACAARARRNQIVRDRAGLQENVLLAISTTGPVLRAGHLRRERISAFRRLRLCAGAGMARRAGVSRVAWAVPLTHRELGRNWSIRLKLREGHSLVTKGVYRYVRHPMYSAFWLWAIAQCLLLPNWIAGPAGLVGFGTLFFGRVRPRGSSL